MNTSQATKNVMSPSYKKYQPLRILCKTSLGLVEIYVKFYYYSESNTLVLTSSIDMRLILKKLISKASSFFPLRVKCILFKLMNIICLILNMELTLALWGVLGSIQIIDYVF